MRNPPSPLGGARRLAVDNPGFPHPLRGSVTRGYEAVIPSGLCWLPALLPVPFPAKAQTHAFIAVAKNAALRVRFRDPMV